MTVRDTRPPVPGSSRGLQLLPADHQYRTVTLAECAGVARDACMGELPLERYGRIVRVTSDESEDVSGVCDGGAPRGWVAVRCVREVRAGAAPGA